VRTLVWSAAFVRALKRAVQRRPELRKAVERTIEQLAQDPYHPTLHTHKLKGKLEGVLACTVDYDNRVLFQLVDNPTSGEKEVLLVTIGTHEEVY
jgi:addiction module RelE/StbE family toxin